MKKILIVLLSMIFMCVAAGCGAKEKPPVQEELEEIEEPIEEEEPELVEEEESQTFIINGYEYTLELPIEWENLIRCEPSHYGADSRIRLIHKASEEAGSGGWLFDLVTNKSNGDMDASKNPYKVLGSISSINNDYCYFFIVYPEEKRCTEETAAEYEMLRNMIPDILEKIQFKDGYGYSFSEDPPRVVKARKEYEAGIETKPDGHIESIGYTMELPDSWIDACYFYIFNPEDYKSGPAFYHRDMHAMGQADGLLFQIQFKDYATEGTDQSNEEIIGHITSEALGVYDVVVNYPPKEFYLMNVSKDHYDTASDSFNERIAKEYEAMYEEIPEVLATLKFKEGIEFSPGSYYSS